MTHKWSSWDHFWPFFGQLHENISQKRGSDSLNLNWIKSYDIITAKKMVMPANASSICRREF